LIKHYLTDKAFQRNVDYFEENGYIFRKTDIGYEFIPMEWKKAERVAINRAIAKNLQYRMNQ
jgi:hypothetical protein